MEGEQLGVLEPSDNVAKTSGFVRYHSGVMVATVGWEIDELGGPKGGSHLRRVRFFFGGALALSIGREANWTFGGFDSPFPSSLALVASSG